jgi:hypothetical protein
MSYDGFDDGFDADALCLPAPDETWLPDQPPPPPDYWNGVTLGSGVAFALQDDGRPDAVTELGRAISAGGGTAQGALVELARLDSLDFQTLDATATLSALVALDRQRGRLDSLQERLLAQLCTTDSSADRWCAEEVSVALRLPSGTARTRLKNAEQLCKRLPNVLRALAGGVIGDRHVRAVVEASYPLPDEVLPEYENRVLAKAGDLSVEQLRRVAKRAAMILDPATAAQRRQRATAQRYVRLAPADDGMAMLFALLPAAEAHAVLARLDGAARLAPAADSRTLDQLRADALVNGVLNGISGELPAVHGRQPRINVTIGLSTLVGADQAPGWLDGYGPIDADCARRLAHDPTGTWRRLVTDPLDGQLLEYGRSRYRPPRHLADHVLARDGECTFPFCSRPASTADLDHVTSYPQGETAASNLQPVHRRHHNAKTRRGWRSQRHPDGSTTWISPLGQRRVTEPPRRWTHPGELRPLEDPDDPADPLENERQKPMRLNDPDPPF